MASKEAFHGGAESQSAIPEAWRREIKRIESHPAFHHLFHSCYINNLHFVMINKELNERRQAKEKSDALEQLNIACIRLQKWAEWKLAEYEIRKNELCVPAEELSYLTEVHLEWARQNAKGNSFLTFPFAQIILCGITKLASGVEYQAADTRYNSIASSFINIPSSAKSFYKVTLYVHADKSDLLLEYLFAKLFDARKFMHKLVERCEIPIRICKGNGFSTDNRSEYMMVSFILNGSLHLDQCDPALSKFAHFLQSIAELSGCAGNYEMEKDYVFLPEQNVTISQGYKNYKRFLSLIGVIDAVYDVNYNHAFLVRQNYAL